jgi:hypothetical protein
MAGDKLKDGFPIAVTFATGEQPSDVKLNGLSNQTQSALRAIERAVGDILDQSQALGGTDKLSNRDLQIANVARLIGPASMLNPQVLHGVRISDYIYTIPVGVKEFVLLHPPLILSSGTWIESTIDWDASPRFTDEKTSVEDLENNTGRVFTYTLTDTGDAALYDYDSIGDSFENASFNVIPDPNQTTERCIASGTSGNFHIDLPYIKYDQDGILATDGSDPNYSEEDFFNTAKAQLPSFLTVLTAGDIIPSGFLYLFDHITGTVVDGAIFRYETQTRFTVEGVELITGSSRYSVLTIGAPLSEILYEVRKRQREHLHDGSDGGKRIAHANLTGNIHEEYVPSAVPGNEHPQYLMRQGYIPGDDSNNSDNVLRGDLLIGSGTPSGNDYTNITADSKSLYFGDTTGPALRYNQIYDALMLASKDLMANGNITVGRNSGVNANTNYFGFGNDPANNHITLDEANKRYQFIIDGTLVGADIEAGNFIARGSSPAKYYFGVKDGVADTYLQGESNTFDFIGAGGELASIINLGQLRVKGGRIYLDNDFTNNSYLEFNDATNVLSFVADSAPNESIFECGRIRLRSGSYNRPSIEMPDAANQIYKDGNTYIFDSSSNHINSYLYAGRLYLGSGGREDWLDGAKINELVDTGYAENPYGGGALHKHYYDRFDYAYHYGETAVNGADGVYYLHPLGYQPSFVGLCGVIDTSGTWGNNGFLVGVYSAGAYVYVQQSDDNFTVCWHSVLLANNGNRLTY